MIDPRDITRQLLELGIAPGAVVLVHTSFSKVGPIEGGPLGLIEALLSALGPTGTLVMPSMTDTDEEPFDPRTTPCISMGVVAETFWRLSGVKRSDNPHAFAALGPRAEAMTAPHPLDPPHGLDSPVGRVYAEDGQILLVGVGHDANTTIHLAENLAGVRYRRPSHVTMRDGTQLTRYDYLEVDHCCQNFSLLDDWLACEGKQRGGHVGHAEARVVRSREIVKTALARLRDEETVFLDPPGVCDECDEARRYSVRDVSPT